MQIIKKYHQRVRDTGSLLCVGLDSNLKRLPRQLAQFDFNKSIIDQTHDLAVAYKLNTAFYEAAGADGWLAMKQTLGYLKTHHPKIVTIADAKRADIGSSNMGYAKAIFDELGFDAVTLHPYLGQSALKPFLDRKDRASIILCRTSNPGGDELQNLQVNTEFLDKKPSNKPLWQVVAKLVAERWNENKNCMVVVGATYPKELAIVRQIVGEMPLLVPGIGAQGGELDKVLEAGWLAKSGGLLINSSRAIIFDDQPRTAAQQLHKAITSHTKHAAQNYETSQSHH